MEIVHETLKRSPREGSHNPFELLGYDGGYEESAMRKGLRACYSLADDYLHEGNITLYIVLKEAALGDDSDLWRELTRLSDRLNARITEQR